MGTVHTLAHSQHITYPYPVPDVSGLSCGESTDEVKQQRIAALSAWKTKFKKPPDEEAPANKVKARLCLRGERTWGETLD